MPRCTLRLAREGGKRRGRERAGRHVETTLLAEAHVIDGGHTGEPMDLV